MWAAELREGVLRRAKLRDTPPDVHALQTALSKATATRDRYLKAIGEDDDAGLTAKYREAKREVERLERAVERASGATVTEIEAVPARLADLTRTLERMLADAKKYPDLAARAKGAIGDLLGPVRIARVPVTDANGKPVRDKAGKPVHGPLARFTLTEEAIGLPDMGRGVRGMVRPEQESNL